MPAGHGVLFKPWVGPHYGIAGPFAPRRVLVVGQSHYGNSAEAKQPDLTRRALEAYIDGSWTGRRMRFYTIAARTILLDPHAPKGACRQLWNSLSFYNFLQKGYAQPRTPVSDLWSDHLTALRAVVNDLKPDIVIVFSKRVWEAAQEALKVKPIGVGLRHPSGRFSYSVEIRELTRFLRQQEIDHIAASERGATSTKARTSVGARS